jgi:hypothetical protein
MVLETKHRSGVKGAGNARAWRVTTENIPMRVVCARCSAISEIGNGRQVRLPRSRSFTIRSGFTEARYRAYAFAFF